MKKTFILIAFVVLVGRGLAQPKIHSATLFLTEKARIENIYTYLDNDKTRITDSWRYERSDSAPRLVVGRTTTRFDDQKRLLSEENTGITKHWQTKKDIPTLSVITNEYNQNGCRTRQRYNYFVNNILSDGYIIDSKVTPQCQIIEERLSREFSDFGTTRVVTDLQAVKTYAYDAKDSLQNINYVYGWGVGYKKILKRQADGKQTEVEEYNVCELCIDVELHHAKTQFQYDNQGRVVSKSIFENRNTMSNPVWQPWDSTHYVYVGKRLAQKKYFSRFQPNQQNFKNATTTNYDYDLYCDGLVKKEATQRIFKSLDFEVNERDVVLYKYTEGSTCNTTATNTVKLFPNPVNWRATIETEDLFSADFNLLIYNDLGQEVARYTIDYRTPSFDFSTQDLPNGAYILKLTNGEKTVPKKMVIAH